MKKIELSAIIPTHKRKDYLFYELEKIYAQRDVFFEIIVVNDITEEDETDTIVENYPEVIYIKDSKIQGPSNKHKAGYQMAKGRYLYMPDDDDYLTDPYFFRKAIDALEQDAELALVSGQCQISYEFDDKNRNYIQNHGTKVRGRIDGRSYLQEFQYRLDKPLSTVSTIFRKRAFDETDAINMVEMSDSSMYMQALLWGDAYVMDDVVAVYRVKGGSLTTTAAYSFMQNVLVQKELLYKRAIGYIERPRDFWAQQFILTYHFWPNKSMQDKLRILSWLRYHLHGSMKLFFFFIKEVFKFFFIPMFYIKCLRLMKSVFSELINLYPQYLINSFCYLFLRNSIQLNSWVDIKYGKLKHRNWGDDINVHLIGMISKKNVIIRNQSLFHRISKKVNYICIGSILGWYENKNSEVWGTGFISKEAKLKYIPKKIHSVRGKLTRQKLLDVGIECPESYGDPALLLSKYYNPKVSKKYRVGFVPHYVDYENDILNSYIDIHNDCIKIKLKDYDKWTDVIDQICSCEVILSSSLHGLIVSDSYGIPNVWINLSDEIYGGDFKYFDYFSSVNRLKEKCFRVNTSSDIDNILSIETIYINRSKIDFQSILDSCPFTANR